MKPPAFLGFALASHLVVAIASAQSLPVVENLAASRTVTAGEAVTLFVQARSDTPLSFQWLRNDTPIPAAEAAELILDPVLESDAGTYRVSATNADGTITSGPIYLDVNPATAPSFNGWNFNLAPLLGEPWTATVEARGSQPKVFDWYRDGELIQSGADNHLVRDVVTSADAGSYTVVVRNHAGTATLGPISITLIQPAPPQISSEVQSQSLTVGSVFNINFDYGGTEPLTFDLLSGDTVVTTSNYLNVLRIYPVTLENAGTYRVRVRNKWGEALTNAFTLSVDPGAPPRADLGDPLFVITPGQPNSLILRNIVGGLPRTYTWFKDGVRLDQADGFTSLPLADDEDVGSYQVVISNLAGTYITAPVAVGLRRPLPPRLLSTSGDIIGLLGTTGNDSIDLRADATGTPPLTYTWTFNGEVIPDATGSTLLRYPLTTDHTGTYTVAVSNAAGTTAPKEIRVQVIPHPSSGPKITRHPASGRASPDGIYELTVDWQGEGTIQWFRKGLLQPSQTGRSFTLRNPNPFLSGNYHAELTQNGVTVASDRAWVSFSYPPGPEFVRHPSHASILPGSSQHLQATMRYFTNTFSRTSFQWFKDGVAIAGATGNGFTVQGQPENAGEYTLAATLDGKTTISNPATVTIDPESARPFFVLVPGDQVIRADEAIELRVTTRTTPSSIRWERNGEPYPAGDGRTSITLVDADGPAAGGAFQVIATLNGETFVSPLMNVSREFDGSTPVITREPSRMLAAADSYTEISVAAEGERPLSYQWRRDDVDIPGADQARLVFSQGFTAADVGEYSVIVSNRVGTATSSTARIDLLPSAAPLITAQPADLTLLESNRYGSLWVGVLAEGPRTYQWYRNGERLEGLTDSFLHFFNLNLPDITGDYHVVVANAEGTQTSRVAHVSIIPDLVPADPPVFTVQPQSRIIAYGDPTTLGANAVGHASLAYQWLKNGVPIPQATSPTLRIERTTSADAGVYTVVVTDPAGITSSLPATITVPLPATPVILGHAAPTHVSQLGDSVSFGVEAISANDLTYQWRKDGVPLPGTNAATLSLTDLSAADAGVYSVEITSTAGRVASRSFPLRLAPGAGQAIGSHRVLGHGWGTDRRITVQNHIQLGSGIESLSWEVLLPTGWTVLSSQSTADPAPSPGTSSLATWTWNSPTETSLQFTVLLQAPLDQVEPATISALVTCTFASGQAEFLVQPEPLRLAPPSRHHRADLNRDGQLDLGELLRVIELYNTRHGTARTGRYRQNTDNSDGFEADPATPESEATPLAELHSADTSADGRIDLAELLRVIELYNFRSGTTRTGAYRPDPTTVDGFAAGPGE